MFSFLQLFIRPTPMIHRPAPRNYIQQDMHQYNRNMRIQSENKIIQKQYTINITRSTVKDKQ
jgi:hypothetical protein